MTMMSKSDVTQMIYEKKRGAGLSWASIAEGITSRRSVIADAPNTTTMSHFGASSRMAALSASARVTPPSLGTARCRPPRRSLR